MSGALSRPERRKKSRSVSEQFRCIMRGSNPVIVPGSMAEQILAAYGNRAERRDYCYFAVITCDVSSHCCEFPVKNGFHGGRRRRSNQIKL